MAHRLKREFDVRTLPDLVLVQPFCLRPRETAVSVSASLRSGGTASAGGGSELSGSRVRRRLAAHVYLACVARGALAELEAVAECVAERDWAPERERLRGAPRLESLVNVQWPAVSQGAVRSDAAAGSSYTAIQLLHMWNRAAVATRKSLGARTSHIVEAAKQYL